MWNDSDTSGINKGDKTYKTKHETALKLETLGVCALFCINKTTIDGSTSSISEVGLRNMLTQMYS